MSNTSALSPVQLWGLGLAAIQSEMSHDDHHSLHGGEDRDKALASMRNALQRDWSVKTREDLLEKIAWLETKGHNHDYMERHRFLAALSDAEREREVARCKGHVGYYHDQLIISNNLGTLENVGIAAWDLGRCINLCRWGIALGLLEESEGWQRILDISIHCQRLFTGWFHFAVSYNTGRQYWRSLATKDFVDHQMQGLRRLTGNPKSPWNTLDWNMPLTPLAEVAS